MKTGWSAWSMVGLLVAGCGYITNEPLYQHGFGTIAGALNLDGMPLEGALIFVVFAVFERKRNEVLRVIDQVRHWDA